MTAAAHGLPFDPPLGAHAAIQKIVPHEWTIHAYDSRLPDVLSTPAMIGLMEAASAIAIEPSLPPGAITVGTRIEVDHLKAVRAGALVEASARLESVRGRFLVFAVEARSGEHLIGRGHVFRAVVEAKPFQSQAGGRTAS